MEKEITEEPDAEQEPAPEVEATATEPAPEAEASAELAPEAEAEAPAPEAGVEAAAGGDSDSGPSVARPSAEERPDYRDRGPARGRPDAGDQDDRRPRRGRGRRRVCIMCADKMPYIGYKDFEILRRFISDRGRIESRRKGGACAKHQRAIAQAIKRARYLALLPYTAEHMRTGVGHHR